VVLLTGFARVAKHKFHRLPIGCFRPLALRIVHWGYCRLWVWRHAFISDSVQSLVLGLRTLGLCVFLCQTCHGLPDFRTIVHSDYRHGTIEQQCMWRVIFTHAAALRRKRTSNTSIHRNINVAKRSDNGRKMNQIVDSQTFLQNSSFYHLCRYEVRSINEWTNKQIYAQCLNRT
jgi:hypothetical protein